MKQSHESNTHTRKPSVDKHFPTDIFNVDPTNIANINFAKSNFEVEFKAMIIIVSDLSETDSFGYLGKYTPRNLMAGTPKNEGLEKESPFQGR